MMMGIIAALYLAGATVAVHAWRFAWLMEHDRPMNEIAFRKILFALSAAMLAAAIATQALAGTTASDELWYAEQLQWCKGKCMEMIKIKACVDWRAAAFNAFNRRGSRADTIRDLLDHQPWRIDPEFKKKFIS